MSLRLFAVAALAASAVVVAGCGGGDSRTSVSGEPISFEQLAASASTSAEATSGRFSFALEATLPGSSEPFALSGEGAFDAQAERASFAIDMSALAKILGGFVSGLAGPNADGLPDFDDPKGWKIQIVQDGSVDYVRFPALDEQLPEGKTWVRGAEGSSGDGFDFEDVEQFTNNDPRELLVAVRGVAGEIETVGSEELRGVATTHYHAVIDPAELARAKDREGHAAPQSLVDQLTAQSGIGDIPLDVWIDANGLVRKLAMAFQATGQTSASSGEATMSFELWDYGEVVEIAVPARSDVADASALRG